MPRKLTSAKARMWAAYNRRRAKDRAADAARRRARAAENASKKDRVVIDGVEVKPRSWRKRRTL